MRNRTLFLLLSVMAAVILGGCSVARSLTTKHMDYSQTLIPDLTGGPFTTPSNSGGQALALPFDLTITGDVRDKFDKYNGGVDNAGWTYSITNRATAPVRIRLWVNIVPVGTTASFDTNARQILDITVPANQTVTVDKSNVQYNDALRQAAEDLLRNGNTHGALFIQGDSTAQGQVTFNNLTLIGRAHGSLF